MRLKKTLAISAIITLFMLSGCAQNSDSGEESETPAVTATEQWKGKWMVDNTGKPYIMPENSHGEPVVTEMRDNEMQNCVIGGQHRTSAVTPQLVEDRFILFSEEDGPGTVDSQTHMPGDYAQTPFGAALAAYNAVSFFAPGDQLAVDSLHYLWDFDVPVDAEPQAEKNVTLFMPDAFRVAGCSPQTVQIQLLLANTHQDWSVMTVPVVWESDQWILRMRQEDLLAINSVADNENIDWEEWTLWPLG